MYPILFHFGFLRLTTYGLMMAVSFIVSISFLAASIRKQGKNPQIYMDLCYYILIASIIGARLFYIGVNLDYFMAHPLDVFKVWQGGLVYYGGLIAAVIMTVVFVHRKGLSLWNTTDILVPAVPLGQVFGRMGCFFAGCCYGRPTDLPWAVTFHRPESLAPLNIPLHPVQLYASLSAFVIFLIVFAASRYKKFEGHATLVYFLIYPIVRSIEELFRGDIERKFLPLPGASRLISTGQVTSLVIFVVALSLYLVKAKQQKSAA